MKRTGKSASGNLRPAVRPSAARLWPLLMRLSENELASLRGTLTKFAGGEDTEKLRATAHALVDRLPEAAIRRFVGEHDRPAVDRADVRGRAEAHYWLGRFTPGQIAGSLPVFRKLAGEAGFPAAIPFGSAGPVA